MTQNMTPKYSKTPILVHVGLVDFTVRKYPILDPFLDRSGEIWDRDVTV